MRTLPSGRRRLLLGLAIGFLLLTLSGAGLVVVTRNLGWALAFLAERPARRQARAPAETPDPAIATAIQEQKTQAHQETLERTETPFHKHAWTANLRWQRAGNLLSRAERQEEAELARETARQLRECLRPDASTSMRARALETERANLKKLREQASDAEISALLQELALAASSMEQLPLEP